MTPTPDYNLPYIIMFLHASKIRFDICWYCVHTVTYTSNNEYDCRDRAYDLIYTPVYYGMYQTNDFPGPLLLTWFNFNPSMDK